MVCATICVQVVNPKWDVKDGKCRLKNKLQISACSAVNGAIRLSILHEIQGITFKV